MPSRVAIRQDLDTITTMVALAFAADPVWGPALALPGGSTANLKAFWRPFVLGALEHSTVYLAPDDAAVALWIPPGAEEMSDAVEASLWQFVAETFPPDSEAAMRQLFTRFEVNHPHDRSHAYLSVLATHPDHRGRGIAQQLLAEQLAEFDHEGVPAYLESSNPANLHRYERLGFRPVGEFPVVVDDAVITTMWRDPAGADDGATRKST
jgi:GNAT superfamily N-acetyltransferase